MYHECASSRLGELLKEFLKSIETDSALDLKRGGPLLCGRLFTTVDKIDIIQHI